MTRPFVKHIHKTKTLTQHNRQPELSTVRAIGHLTPLEKNRYTGQSKTATHISSFYVVAIFYVETSSKPFHFQVTMRFCSIFPMSKPQASSKFSQYESV